VAISWIAAYLSDRKQRVVVNQTKTDWKPVEAGVIQGSVLGPILFLLFIHDINEVIPEGIELEKYADDILAYIIGNTEHIHGSLPQKTIEAINSWCTVNDMRLNTTKCKVMTIGNGTIINPMPPLYLNDHALESVNTYKYLGIEINAQLE
jgi:ribonucleases P/MRP protein subunit RPP40